MKIENWKFSKLQFSQSQFSKKNFDKKWRRNWLVSIFVGKIFLTSQEIHEISKSWTLTKILLVKFSKKFLNKKFVREKFCEILSTGLIHKLYIKNLSFLSKLMFCSLSLLSYLTERITTLTTWRWSRMESLLTLL